MSEEEKVETPSVEGQSSDEIRTLLEGGATAEPVKVEEEKPVEAPKEEKPVEEPEVQEEPKEEEWYDKKRGFKTRDDADKAYAEAQNKIRELSENQKRYESELTEIKEQSLKRPLTQDEQQRQEAIQSWKHENKDAIDFLKQEIKKDMEKENEADSFKKQALDSRKKWKDDFDKDESRKVLWSKMEEHYKDRDVFQEFAKNPFPYLEAVAFQQDFPSIAEKIRAEAVEDYKKQIKEAEEAESSKATGSPGGSAKSKGAVDPGAMSSEEISSLLPRNDNG